MVIFLKDEQYVCSTTACLVTVSTYTPCRLLTPTLLHMPSRPLTTVFIIYLYYVAAYQPCKLLSTNTYSILLVLLKVFQRSQSPGYPLGLQEDSVNILGIQH